MTIPSITDGLSNTFMVCELAGRPDVYNARRQVIAQGVNPGAGWGDGFNGEHWPNGTSFDGNIDSTGNIPAGTCLINCSNYQSRAFYSFHSGGCNFLLVSLASKLALISGGVLREPLPHFLIRPGPLERVCVPVIVFGP
jgi:hypothetical protein